MINLDTNCAINIPPKNDIKLDKDEYILCEYKEKHIKNLFIKFIFAVVCIAVFIYTVISKDFADQSLFLKVCAAIFVIFCMLLIYIFIVNLIHKGLYVTNKNLIAFNGARFDLDSIFILDTSAREHTGFRICKGWRSILEIKCTNNDAQLDAFLLSLSAVSGNKIILRFGSKELKEKADSANLARFKLTT